MRILFVLARLMRLLVRDAGLLLGLAALQLGIALALRIAPLAPVRRCLQRLQPVARLCSISERRVAWALDATARRLRVVNNCLVGALAAELVLAGSVPPTRLVLGVRRAGKQLEGHAWVERGGRVIVGVGAPGRGEDAEPRSYTPMLGWDA